MHTQFQQGRAARLAGKPVTANPHQPHDKDYNDWHDGWTSQPRPAYRVRDNCLGVLVADGLTYDEASRTATRLTRKADANGEKAVTMNGLDRFTVHRDYD